MGDLARKAHGADGGSRSLQRLAGVGSDKGRRQGRELAARAGDGTHHWVAVADAVGFCPIGHDVNGTGNGHNGTGLCGKSLGKGHRAVQVFLGDPVGHIGIHALGGARTGSQRLYLGDVAPDDRELHLVQQAVGRLGAQGGSACAHRVQHHGVAQCIGLFACLEHGFNGAAATNGIQLATIFATTTVAPAVATCTVMLITWIKYGKPDVAMCLNGSLAGLVAITAGCDAVNVFGSFVIGILSGCMVCFIVWLLDYKLKVDDPVGAVAVHFGNGVLGTICVGLFACGTDTMPEAQGLFYGGGFHLLGVQLLGLLAIGAWTAVTMCITFFIIKKTVGLRVSAHEEIVGLDKMEHGLESAYAGFALEADVPGDYLETVQDSSYTPSVDVEDAVPTKVIHSDGSISKVVIITKAEKFDKIKAALNEIGIGGMTVTKVSGCGVQKGQTSYYRGAKVNMELLPKLKVEVVVSEVPVADVVKAAKKALYTGNIGDGKIFVYDVVDVVRISTSARGKDALKYEE